MAVSAFARVAVCCRIGAAVLVASTLGSLAAGSELRLMPWPREVTPGLGALSIDARFRVEVKGCVDPRVESAAGRVLDRISRMTGTQFSGATEAASLIIECGEAKAEGPALGEDESYELQVEAPGAQLTARSTVGCLHGLETFVQLIRAGESGFEAAAVRIEDSPRFVWRGLMIDVSRHWMPVAVIERNLDAMAAAKMNVLHWHLTDDQGFRVESKLFPRLQQFGSDGHFYSQDEIRRVVAFARERGIRVVPEFDIPGHATSWLVGMPELGSGPKPAGIERTWGIFEPTIDPAREETYAFLDAFIGEMAGLFPDPYFHIGGDEVEDKQWKESQSIQAFMAAHGFKTSQELHTYFNQRVEKILGKHGKTLAGWDEVLAPGLGTGAIIQSWRGQQSLADAARKGYRGILSFGYYLDHLRPASFHYANDPLNGAAHDLSSEESARILGGEACMWSEYVSEETIDSRIWPRAAAIAERLWSPAGVRDVDSMYTRLDAFSRELDWVGAQHRANLGRMVDEIAGGGLSEPLRVLANAVEALGIEGRRGARKYSSLVALNRMVDAARPESESIRAFTGEVAAWRGRSVSSKAGPPAELSRVLASWRDNYARLSAIGKGNCLIQEILPISEELSKVGAIGLAALNYLESGRAAPAGWISRTRHELAEMEKPKDEVVLAAARPVRMLIEAVANPAKPLKSEHVRSVTNLPVTQPQPF